MPLSKSVSGSKLKAPQSTTTKTRSKFGAPASRYSDLNLTDPDADQKLNERERKLSQRRSTIYKPVIKTTKLTLEEFVARLRINGATVSSRDDIESSLFKMFSEDGALNMRLFIETINASGIRYTTDPRLKKLNRNIEAVEHYLMSTIGQTDDEHGIEQNLTIDEDLFKGMIMEDVELLNKIFKDALVVPEFKSFTQQIRRIYQQVLQFRDTGHVASYIPQLGRADPNWFGVSICTIDGQRWSVGDTKIPYTVQSSCKPINYALALSEYSSEHVHSFVGKEPSGVSFNSIALDKNNKPHNPMINSGAIMVASLLHPEKDLADRFDWLHQRYSYLAGKQTCGFNNAVYLSELKEGHRNYALGHYMKESNSFPKHTDLKETLEFYFQACSLEVNCESHAVMAATLANSGICPITDERILTQEAVRKCLSLMLSCGMYDYSGHFAFEIGIPAKSGVSGCIMLVIPKLCGIALFSPQLDECGNSVRGIEFCKEIVKIFAFHHFDAMMPDDTTKLDPRGGCAESKNDKTQMELCFAAERGDVHAIKRLTMGDVDVKRPNYDERTPLHIAAASGRIDVVKYLLTFYDKIDELTMDRYDRTALDDAKHFGHNLVADVIEAWFCEKEGPMTVKFTNNYNFETTVYSDADTNETTIDSNPDLNNDGMFPPSLKDD